MAGLAKKKMELASAPNFDAPFLSQKANKENADMNQYWYSESSIQVPRTNLSTMCPISLRSYADHRRRSPRRLLSRRLRFYSQHLFFASGRARKVRQQSFGCKRAESRIVIISLLIFAASTTGSGMLTPGLFSSTSTAPWTSIRPFSMSAPDASPTRPLHFPRAHNTAAYAPAGI